MNKKKIIRLIGGIILIGGLVAVGIIYLLFNKPHRDVQATKTDYSLTSAQLVNEYLAAPDQANEKYLDDEGESKILEVTGKVYSISTDMNDQTVVLLKNDGDKAGVSCTFTISTNASAKNLRRGQTTTIKGVIRSGAGFDKDLDFYEDVILEKCDVSN
jgi:tRNA_anti-like